MTAKKLQQYNGKNGNKAYVAYRGKVYNVSDSALWKNGTHKGIHEAGLDLTQAMENAPHADEVFAGFDVVDTFNENNEHKIAWVKWYKKYHPHPMLVHFPIALHLFAAGLNILFILYLEPSFATAVFYSLFAATIMGIFAMLSGMLSWYINYQMALTQIFIIKISLSIITLVLGTIAIGIYLADPEVIYLSSFPSLFYHSTIFITGITVIVLAYNGGKLTWPDKESS